MTTTNTKLKTIREAHRASLQRLHTIIQMLQEYHYDLAMIQLAADQIEQDLLRNKTAELQAGIEDEPVE